MSHSSDLIFPGGVDVVVDGLLLPRQTKEGAHGRRGRCDQLQACHGSVQVRLRAVLLLRRTTLTHLLVSVHRFTGLEEEAAELPLN